MIGMSPDTTGLQMPATAHFNNPPPAYNEIPQNQSHTHDTSFK